MAAAVVVAVSLKAAMICVGVALVSPMYAFRRSGYRDVQISRGDGQTIIGRS
jgi:hypothetical protein